MWPFALFLLWPLVEIALFVTVGGSIGLLATLAVILGTGVLGVWLMRSQGARTATQLRAEMASLRDPLAPVAHGALRLVAGVLLVLPGFLTDALGLVLLLPPVRVALIGALARRVKRAMPPRGAETFDARMRRGDIVIEGEFIEVDPDTPRPPSGWTRP